ncbi:STAS domain-containing protein [Blastococcus xanthinilyticus]|uniref:Anti-anti-sigma factor n=1 Tax=Blastococcus xanthinilyticus TaxID=1564164 RepID=A0A5S5CK25_9ACTN|nr:STAS domain-containing protein [Blastococcus xanthinilyticus]TYP80645.1 anti-anti-sigma factor [Blastococcus xanthinilyticus]
MRPADRVHRIPLPGGVAPGHGPDEVVLRVTDDMLAEGVADIRWLLHDALLTGARWVVVDVRGVEHLTGAAAASLLSAHRTCRARGGSVVLRGPSRRTLELLRRTGLSRVLGLEGLGRSA